MILNNNTEFYGHALLVNGSGDSFVGTHTVLVSRRTASMSRSASKSKLAGSVGSKGKKESVAPDEEETKPEVPQLAWRVLSQQAIRELVSLTVEEVAAKLAEILSFGNCTESLKEAAQLDYFVAGYWFAREHKFTDEQISAFFTLLHIMLENLKVQQLSLSASVMELQRHMVGVGVSPDTTSLRCFTQKEAVLAVEYLSSTLLQHYRLFHLLFTEQQQEELLTTKLFVDLPPDPSSISPPPLEEAVPLDLYQRCMLPTPPSLSEEQKKEQLEEAETTVGDGDEARLLNVSAEELKLLMETMAKETLSSYQSEVSQKLKSKQEALLNRIAKLEKTVT